MMSTKIKALAAVTVLAAVGALILWRGLANHRTVSAEVIAGNGTMEATEVEISARLAGRLARVTAREGDEVAAGQLLLELDSGDLEGQVLAAEGNLAAARAALGEILAGTREEEMRRLAAQLAAAEAGEESARARLDLVRAGARTEQKERLKADLRQAEAALNDSETELGRVRRLVGEGALPGRDLDRATARRDGLAASAEAASQRLAEAQAGARPEEVRDAEAGVAHAEAQVKAARAAVDLARAGARPETVAAARARVEQARGTLETARHLLEQTRVSSPLDARVTERAGEPGEVVTPGFPVLRLADLGDVWLRVYVPEPQVGRVKLGQEADVTTDSFPGKVFRGRVAEISEEPEFTPKNVQTREERVKLVFGVKISVENPDMELKPGMPADAAIHVGRR